MLCLHICGCTRYEMNIGTDTAPTMKSAMDRLFRRGFVFINAAIDTVLAIIIRMATIPYDVPQNAAWTLERATGTRLWGTEELFMIILRYNKKTNRSSMTCKHHHIMVWC